MPDTSKKKSKLSQSNTSSGSTQGGAGAAVLPCGRKRITKPAPPPDKITLSCEHKREFKKPISTLKLVPDFNKDTDKVSVKWDGPNKPPKLTVSNVGEISGGGSYSIDFKYTFPDKLGMSDLKNLEFRKLWRTIYTKHSTTNKYRVKEIWGGLPVEVYNPEQWELSIQIPPMRGYSAGSKLMGGKTWKGDDYSGSESTASSRTHTSASSTSVVSNSSSVKVTTETGVEKRSNDDIVSIQRNGSLVKNDALTIISGVIALIQLTYDIVKGIKDNAPSVGWYFDFSLTFFQGPFVLAWGWKENSKTHEVYYWLNVKVDITIIGGKLEIGFGVSFVSFKAQVFGNLGGEIKLAISGENNEEGKIDGKVELTGEIKGALGARFEAGYFLKIEATLSTGIKASKRDLEISLSTGISGGIEIKWTGIKGVVTASTGKGGWLSFYGSKTKDIEVVLMEEEVIKVYRFFTADSYQIPKISKQMIKEEFYQTFSTGWDLRIFDSEDWIGSNRYSNDSAASDIAEALEKMKDIKKDRKSIEALAYEVRQFLDFKAVRKWRRDYLLKKDFDFFVDNELRVLVRDFKDPLYDLTKKK